MLEEILISQRECVIMRDFNLLYIDWTLQRPTPAPGNKLMQLLADNNLTQPVHETTRKNNMLGLVISTEEEPLLIVNLKIIDEIGDHQAILYSIKTENGNRPSEKKLQEEKILMQCGLNLTTKPLNNRLSKIMPS